MAEKWADYVITGVWKSGDNISYVMLHEDNGNTISSPGKKVSREDAIKLIKAGKTMVTAVWNYKEGNWSYGSQVGYVKGTPEYLRSHKDSVVNDNLDNLLLMTNFF
eukprot:TRINITY_DN71291_c0_g1_i1.p1 TRINITY_DN71291_c0_g1~~TRINITY_DN71291_c0_g1_i1.p1  ORF type:complete len:106 (-),score=9.92 TRINITY_DN71291_c0_g1_i1:24-341(-)